MKKSKLLKTVVIGFGVLFCIAAGIFIGFHAGPLLTKDIPLFPPLSTVAYASGLSILYIGFRKKYITASNLLLVGVGSYIIADCATRFIFM
jgi:hypothetical protein